MKHSKLLLWDLIITFVLCFISIEAHGALDLTGLIGLWLFDDAKEDIAKDSSQNKNDGKLDAGAKWDKGKFDGGLITTAQNGINYGPNDGLDADALTNAEIDLRGRILQISEIFRKYIAGCEECYVAGPAPSVGQRRSRAIHCEYELSQEDCTEGRQFEDQIGCFGFIDNSKYFVREAGAYGIPYRALIPKGLDNALIAGRMMTVDLVAHNSTRNTVCCLLCGQAAGTAAAMSAIKNIEPINLDSQELRKQLLKQGVLLKPKIDPIRE